MNPILGQDVVLFFLKDGLYQEFLCATECAISIQLDTKEVRTINGGKWKKVRGQKLSYKVSLSGMIKLVGGNPITFWLVENQIQMLPLSWRMGFVEVDTALEKLVTGSALINTSELTASSTSFANSNFEFEGDGALEITNSATVCNATIGELTPGAGEAGEISIGYSGVTNAARLEYSVDGGAREVGIFDPGSFGVFYIVGLSEGSHTIVVYAVCESGVDGETNELIVEVEGGEPVSCAAPGTPVISDITATSATATWPAASPVPADGYSWILVETVGFTVVDSGTTSGLTAGLTDLDDGVTYSFRVKSLCETGVSESSYQSIEFTAEDPASCNVPGTPVISAITNTTATATWTAPTPAPDDGYEWEVLNGLTVIDSGTTAGLTVNLTGLPQATLLTFRVKALCEVGVSESGFNSENFVTTNTSSIDWSFNEDLGNGTLVIEKNSVIVVNVTTAGTGNFTANGGNNIDITLSAVTGNITVTDLTSSTEIVNVNDTGTTIGSFTVTAGHNYLIEATVTS